MAALCATAQLQAPAASGFRVEVSAFCMPGCCRPANQVQLRLPGLLCLLVLLHRRLLLRMLLLLVLLLYYYYYYYHFFCYYYY